MTLQEIEELEASQLRLSSTESLLLGIIKALAEIVQKQDERLHDVEFREQERK